MLYDKGCFLGMKYEPKTERNTLTSIIILSVEVYAI